jgi:hypothetical protein
MPGLGSLPRLIGNYADRRTTACYITPLDPVTDAPENDKIRSFQYFPETLEDNRESNWEAKPIPGGSLPLYQWLTGGARTVSFRAMFTSDVDFEYVTQDRLHAMGVESRNVDVNSAVLWLRSFQMPSYGSASQVGMPLTRAPRKLLLTVPVSGIGWGAGQNLGLGLDEDTVLCVMTECSVSWEAFWPSGRARIASVQCGFTQLAQMAGRVSFPQYTSELSQRVYNTSGSGIGPFRGYIVRPKGAKKA